MPCFLDVQDLQFDIISESGCIFQKQIQRLLDGQASNTYRIHQIQCGKGLNGLDCYVFWSGDKEKYMKVRDGVKD